jgi:glycine/D-amino acid oxidase-like deaminating enzyme
VTVTLWSKTAVASHDRPSLEGNHSVDVCVVGAGVGGVTASYFLASGGASVVLLEADRVGSGAMGKSSGFVNAGLWMPPSDIIKAIGEVYGPRLIATLGAAPKKTFDLIKALGLECDARHAGTLQCAPDEAGFNDLKERLAASTNAGSELKVVEAGETARLTGATVYRGALIDFRAGVLQPLSYVRGLAAAAEKAGATIYEKSVAVRFDFSVSRWLISTGGGSIAAKWLLVATEAHMIGAHFDLLREYVPMPYFNAATRPLTNAERAVVMPADLPIVDLRKVVSSYRFDGHGRLIVGSIGEIAGFDGAINRRWVARKVAQLFPKLRGVDIEFAWVGTIGITSNHMPTVHRIGAQAFALGGYNGRGIAAGTVFGERVSDVILGRLREEALPVPVTEPRVARLAGLRANAFRTGAAAFHVIDARWK